MVTDRQVRRLMSLLQKEQSLQVSAEKVGMDRQTARKYRKTGKLPSASRTDHDWRTRADPFAGVWPWVAGQLSVNPGLEARTLLEALQRLHRGQFADGQLRTLQRQVKRWRGLEGPGNSRGDRSVQRTITPEGAIDFPFFPSSRSMGNRPLGGEVA